MVAMNEYVMNLNVLNTIKLKLNLVGSAMHLFIYLFKSLFSFFNGVW